MRDTSTSGCSTSVRLLSLRLNSTTGHPSSARQPTGEHLSVSPHTRLQLDVPARQWRASWLQGAAVAVAAAEMAVAVAARMVVAVVIVVVAVAMAVVTAAEANTEEVMVAVVAAVRDPALSTKKCLCFTRWPGRRRRVGASIHSAREGEMGVSARVARGEVTSCTWAAATVGGNEVLRGIVGLPVKGASPAGNADGCRLLGWVRKDWDTAISIVTMSATSRILHHLSSFPSQKSFPSQNSSFRAWRRSAAFRAALARKKHEKPASFRFPSA